MKTKIEEMEYVMYGERLNDFIPNKKTKKSKMLSDIKRANDLFRNKRKDLNYALSD